MKCAVFSCNNSYKKKPKCAFFAFPKNPKLLKQWQHFCHRKDIFNTKAAWICGEHFKVDDIETNLKIKMGYGSRKILKPGTIPSIYHAKTKRASQELQDCSNRLQRHRNTVVSPLNANLSILSKPESENAEPKANCASTPGEPIEIDPTESTNLKVQIGFPVWIKIHAGTIISLHHAQTERDSKVLQDYSNRFQRNTNKICSPLNVNVSIFNKLEPEPAEPNENGAESIEIDPPEPTNLEVQIGSVSWKQIFAILRLYQAHTERASEVLEDYSNRLQKHRNEVVSPLNANVSILSQSEPQSAEPNATMQNLKVHMGLANLKEINTFLSLYQTQIERASKVLQGCSNRFQRLSINIIEDLQEKIQKLKKENFILKEARKTDVSENNVLKMNLMKSESETKRVDEHLLQIFTDGQLKKLKTGMQNMHWTEDDIAKSITLYSASAKAYKLLRRQNFPLPGVRTLQRWAQKIDISPGILKPVLQIMSGANQLNAGQKVCVLSFDEMMSLKTSSGK